MQAIPFDVALGLAFIALAAGALIGAALRPARKRPPAAAYFHPRTPVDPQPYGEWTPEHGAAVAATRRIA